MSNNQDEPELKWWHYLLGPFAVGTQRARGATPDIVEEDTLNKAKVAFVAVAAVVGIGVLGWVFRPYVQGVKK